MLIEREDNQRTGAFFITADGERVAEMSYRWTGEKVFTIDHTEVSEQLAGKGIGKQLVSKAVAFARENDYRIIAFCPFAKKVFERTPEFGDVLTGRPEN